MVLRRRAAVPRERCLAFGKRTLIADFALVLIKKNWADLAFVSCEVASALSALGLSDGWSRLSWLVAGSWLVSSSPHQSAQGNRKSTFSAYYKLSPPSFPALGQFFSPLIHCNGDTLQW
eukprot:scaffold86788_cov65-Phaeocystis_antarctica.AAC.5